jgi:hypothetical protein
VLDIAAGLRWCAQALGRICSDVDALRVSRLPDAYDSDHGAPAAERRLRLVAGFADDSGAVLEQAGRQLEVFAGSLEVAQRHDADGRERLRATAGLAQYAEDPEALRSSYADSMEEMAGAVDVSEQAATEAARRLDILTDAASGALLGADLSPAAGTEPYDRARQDLDSLPAELVATAMTYARFFDVPAELLVALLMQEQPFYAGGPGWFQDLAGSTYNHGGRLRRWATGKDTSIGVAQMKPETAQRILREAGYPEYDIDELRSRMTNDDEFAVALAALHLKLDLDEGMTEKQAYLAYAVDEETGDRLKDPSRDPLRDWPELSPRSARYDANLQAINQAGDLLDQFGIDSLPEPRYGTEGGAGGLFEPALAPLPFDTPQPDPTVA